MTADHELVEAFLSGDDDAAGELVRRYERPVYALVYRMTRDMEESKDLTQQAFLKAFKGLGGFRREASFKTWLFQIAVNTTLNHIEQRKEPVELDDTIASPQQGALTTLIDGEARRQVRKGLDVLPARQRLAVILRVYDGLSCAETAAAMGCSEGAVKAHYHQGVQKLKTFFKERGYGRTA